MRMNQSSITQAAVRWLPVNQKRGRGRPKIDWIQTVKDDMKRGGSSWEQMPEMAVDRKSWKKLTALCVSGAGGSKVYILRFYARRQS